MPFMDPEIYKTTGTEIETDWGTCYVPSDVMTPPTERIDDDSPDFAEWCKVAGDYCEGGPSRIRSLAPCAGWFARMSAAGYLDCTEWCCYQTKREALDALSEMYGDGDDSEE